MPITNKEQVKQTWNNKYILKTVKSVLILSRHPDCALVIFYSQLHASRQEGIKQHVVSQWCLFSCCKQCVIVPVLKCLWENAVEMEREMRKTLSSELWNIVSVICLLKFWSQTLQKVFRQTHITVHLTEHISSAFYY